MKRGSLIRSIGVALCAAMFYSATTAKADAPSADPAADIQVAPPVIPDHKFNLLDFGGNGDGATFNTDAFKKAVAAISAAGGGHLEIPPGTYLTLAFPLTSHMDLHLDAGAIIKAPESLTAWGLPDPQTAKQSQLEGLVGG